MTVVDELLDPGEPGEAASSIKAKDLVGHPCIFVPRQMGEWDAKEEERDDAGKVIQQAQDASPYVECSVWKLDRAGVVDQAEGVRVSWYRVVPQLQDKVGRYVAAMPIQDAATGNGKSIILTALSKDLKAVAQTTVDALKKDAEYVAAQKDGSEPF